MDIEIDDKCLTIQNPMSKKCFIYAKFLKFTAVQNLATSCTYLASPENQTLWRNFYVR